MNNVAISELLLLVLLVLLPTVTLFNLIDKLHFLPRVPVLPTPLKLEGFSQDRNTLCLYFGGEIPEKNILLVLEGRKTVPIEVSIEGGKACFELNVPSGYYYVRTEGGVLGKVYVFNPVDVLLSHGLVFGGKNPERYEDVLFYGDYNKVYIKVPENVALRVESPCLKEVTCSGNCVTETTSYGTCTVKLYVGSSLMGTKEINIYQYKECASSEECNAHLYSLSTDFYAVLLVKPTSEEDIRLSTSTPKDFNWKLIVDFNGTYFRIENTSPAVRVSLQNVIIRNVFLGSPSGDFSVSNLFPDNYDPLRVVIEDSNLGGSLSLSGIVEVELYNTVIIPSSTHSPLYSSFPQERNTGIRRALNSYCVVDGVEYEILTLDSTKNARITDANLCYLGISGSKDVNISNISFTVSEAELIKIKSSQDITIEHINVFTKDPVLVLVDSNNITLKDVNLYGDNTIVSDCNGCSTYLIFDVSESNSYVYSSSITPTIYVVDGNLYIFCRGCGNGHYLVMDTDDNSVDNGASLEIDCDCLVAP